MTVVRGCAILELVASDWPRVHALTQGDGDSEIALVVEDEDYIPSMMDGRPYTAARFAASLRRKLFRRACPLSYQRNSRHDLHGPLCSGRASRLDSPAERDLPP
jgi:hypothetical protein